jgi:hypothetical protein
MRKLVVVLAAASSLSLGTAANAAITVTGSTNVDAPITVVNGATQSTIDWGRNPEPAGNFSGAVDIFNSLSGLYSIIVSTSTPGATITNLSLTGIGVPAGGTPPAGVGSFTTVGSSNSLSLLVTNVAVGNYRIAFSGTAPANGAVATGNLTFQVQAVPEPGTWGMMLLGFGAMGFAIRRRRRPVLAQIA